MKSTELTIETAQVEIKVIRVGGHKMTLSVFHQIPVTRIERLLGRENFDSLLKMAISEVMASFEGGEAVALLSEGCLYYRVLGYVLSPTHGQVWLVYTEKLGDETFLKRCLAPQTGTVWRYIEANFSQLFIAT